MTSNNLQYIWENGFYASLCLTGILLFISLMFFMITLGDGDDNKAAARLSLATLFLGPIACAAWPLAAVAIVILLFWALIRGAIHGI